ncbi:bifunctional metallophosphatase/5'-nucleotidase [Prescottella equi]|uniref:bifunctional metallophosphatase/5'-nucleotidase n=1 Tax=Rhodococcus hoagii TaxID=43767 RepID=UPI0011A03A2C|nr:5'-nucleotidase C-terminal domain-containing protein [Prescottella equi]MBM4471981.1 bifunctional metallophosphatase/5'-nucleotidase [Prescottella equi]NKS87225.1 bifunctional metallophosphatase/5'-nucleotidase [Prescottella equi]
MSGRRRRGPAIVLAAALGTSLTVGAHTAQARPPDVDKVPVRLMAINDLHGSLQPPQGARAQILRPDGPPVDAGGAAYLAAYIRQLRGQAPNSLLYSVGDNWGSSPIESALFHDEPAVNLLNTMGVDAASVGTHELDEGFGEFRRMQTGGCHTVDGCQFETEFAGAKFPVLAANMTLADGTPATLPFMVNYVDGVPVGVIGVMPSDTPSKVAVDGVAGLEFGDELATIDRTAATLDFLGVHAIVVLLHRGDEPTVGGPNSCDLADGPVRTIATRATPLVDAIFTADSHAQYNCSVDDPAGDPRPVMQAASHGRIVSVVDMTLDRATGEVDRPSTQAFNQIVTQDIPPDPTVADLVARAGVQSAEVAQRPVGAITADITREPGPGGESPLGDLIADAQLAAARGRGAQIALTNPGGVRTDLLRGADGTATFGDAYQVQPFVNSLEVRTLTGAQLKEVLEQQFQTRPDGSTLELILAPSASLTYRIDRAAPVGARIADLRVDGTTVVPDGRYRVAVNKFLADGGDGFTALRGGTEPASAGNDLEALTSYLEAHSPVAPPAPGRIAIAAPN